METKFENIKDFLTDATIANACQKHQAIKNEDTDSGYNIFHLFSDFYYRENFHSDIIKSLLDCGEKHNEGNKFLRQFILLLKRFIPAISELDYYNSIVTREEGRIDILIKNEKSGKAIIIENKINDAKDQDRQLPEYYKKLSDNFTVEAIVYLSLYGNKKPSVQYWEESEKAQLSKIIIELGAHSGSENDLYNGWLRHCETNAENVDALFVIRQYRKLINEIGGTIMDNQLLENFYNELVKGDNYNVAITIRDIMTTDIAVYLAQRIVDKFNQAPRPFSCIFLGVPHAVFHEWFINESNYAMTVTYNPKSMDQKNYEIRFFDRNQLGIAQEVNSILRKNGFEESEGEFYKYFSFPKEIDEMIIYLQSLLTDFNEIKVKS